MRGLGTMTMKPLWSLLALLPLAGCTTAPTRVGVYGNEPVAQKVRGSNAQAVVTRVLDFSKDEVYEAAGKAMLRLGYNSQDKNPQLGRITGNGFFDCGGGLAPPVTMAVYCRQISTKPETQLTIIPGSSMSIQPCPRA